MRGQVAIQEADDPVDRLSEGEERVRSLFDRVALGDGEGGTLGVLPVQEAVDLGNIIPLEFDIECSWGIAHA